MQKNNYPIFIREIFEKIEFFLERNENKIIIFYYIDLFTCIKNYIHIISLSLSDKEALDLDEQFDILKNKFNISINKNSFIKLQKYFIEIAKYYDKDDKFFLEKNILNKVENKIKKLEKELSQLLETNIFLTVKNNRVKNILSYISLNNKLKIKYIKNNKNLKERAFYIKLNDKYFILKTNKIFSDDINKFYYPDKKEDITGKLYNAFVEYLLEGNPFYLKKNIVIERKLDINKENNYKEENIYIDFPEVYNSIKDLLKKNTGYLIISGPKGIGKTTFINNLKFQDINIKIFEIKNNTSINQLEDFIKNISEKNKTIYIFDNIEKIENFNLFISKINLVNNNYFIFTTLNIDYIEINQFTKNLDYINIPYLNINNLKLLIHKIAQEKSVLFDIDDYNKILSKSNGIIYYAKVFIKQILGNKKYFDKEKKILRENISSIINYLNDKDFEIFLSIILINKDGLHISEIQELLNSFDKDKIDFFLKSFKEYIIKTNGRYKISSSIVSDIIKDLIDNDLTKKAHYKVIDFYEPWDKKVYSNTLKYLPYHYLQVNEIDKLKDLLKSNFMKSKLKIYPFELLEDIKNIIEYTIKNDKDNISDIVNYSFLYQELKDDVKKEILNINSYIKTRDFFKVNKLIDYINLPHNKVYFILIVAILSYEDNFIDYSKKILKNISLLDEKINKELLFKLIAYLGTKGLLDIISFPKNIEEALLFIKNIKEIDYSEQLISLTLKMTNNIFSEIEKGTLIEQLIVKVSEFKDINFIEKFLIEVLNYIDKINEKSIKDSLYYTHIMAIMKFPDLYSKFLPILIDIKNKL